MSSWETIVIRFCRWFVLLQQITRRLLIWTGPSSDPLTIEHHQRTCTRIVQKQNVSSSVLTTSFFWFRSPHTHSVLNTLYMSNPDFLDCIPRYYHSTCTLSHLPQIYRVVIFSTGLSIRSKSKTIFEREFFFLSVTGWVRSGLGWEWGGRRTCTRF